MTIDLWGLGLQAINVLVLVWLLSRVFWRPVAAAIAKRQETARAVIESATQTRAEADRALAEATEARAGIAAERAAMLEAARQEAAASAKTALAEAQAQAEALLAAADRTIEQKTEAARKANERQASDLSLQIAARLLGRLTGPAAQAAFLSQLVDALTALPAEDRRRLATDPKGLDIVSATDLGPEQEKTEEAIATALGGSPQIRFTTNPDLIAGLELHGQHFVLHNSWQADLTQIRKAVRDAA